MLRNIAGLRDRTVILVSHRPAADGICEKHWRLRQGRLLTEAEENTPG
jgi:ABC-type lipoprotein export system ATPase subunit